MSTSAPTSAISPIRNGRRAPAASTFGEMASADAAPVPKKHVAHTRGLALALAATSLRWVPVPYPATSDTKQWRQQAESMVANGSLAKCHLTRAQQVGAFTAQNLKDAVFLRNRMGFNSAFIEDSLLTGMLAARATKGLASRIRADAIQEAQKEAKRLKDEWKLTAAAREQIGPRGGLPVLRQDLLRLAALLHVEVAK